MFNLYKDLTEEERQGLLDQGLLAMAASLLNAGGQGQSTGQGLGGGLMAFLNTQNQGAQGILDQRFRNMQSDAIKAQIASGQVDSDYKRQQMESAKVADALKRRQMENNPNLETWMGYTPQQRKQFSSLIQALNPRAMGQPDMLSQLLSRQNKNPKDDQTPQPDNSNNEPGIMKQAWDWLNREKGKNTGQAQPTNVPTIGSLKMTDTAATAIIKSIERQVEEGKITNRSVAKEKFDILDRIRSAGLGDPLLIEQLKARLSGIK